MNKFVILLAVIAFLLLFGGAVYANYTGFGLVASGLPSTSETTTSTGRTVPTSRSVGFPIFVGGGTSGGK